mmetsp:Transcript_47656/g.136562  ORF Transcript_47656/g.136562 Transcript_47656/m.136562 type:complete len:360 (-) Transcript_47656:293-1372(-)
MWSRLHKEHVLPCELDEAQRVSGQVRLDKLLQTQQAGAHPTADHEATLSGLLDAEQRLGQKAGTDGHAAPTNVDGWGAGIEEPLHHAEPFEAAEGLQVHHRGGLLDDPEAGEEVLALLADLRHLTEGDLKQLRTVGGHTTPRRSVPSHKLFEGSVQQSSMTCVRMHSLIDPYKVCPSELLQLILSVEPRREVVGVHARDAIFPPSVERDHADEVCEKHEIGALCLQGIGENARHLAIRLLCEDHVDEVASHGLLVLFIFLLHLLGLFGVLQLLGPCLDVDAMLDVAEPIGLDEAAEILACEELHPVAFLPQGLSKNHQRLDVASSPLAKQPEVGSRLLAAQLLGFHGRRRLRYSFLSRC